MSHSFGILYLTGGTQENPVAEEFRDSHIGQSYNTGRVPISQGGICRVGGLKDGRKKQKLSEDSFSNNT